MQEILTSYAALSIGLRMDLMSAGTAARMVCGTLTKGLPVFTRWQHLYLVLILIIGLFVGSSMGSVCHQACSCNSTTKGVLCSKVFNISWTQFLSTLPPDTLSLVIENTTTLQLPNEDTYYEISLRHLKILEIKNSNISHFHIALLASMPKLQELIFHNSNLQHINATYNAKLKTSRTLSFLSLKKLDLSSNKLTHIPHDIFPYIPNVEQLVINNNNLLDIDDHAFQDLKQLHLVDLSNNEIYFVHSEAFRNLSNLRTVHLERNALQHLHAWTFRDLGTTSVVNLQENPWDCSCGLRWLVKELRMPHTSNSIPATAEHRYNFGVGQDHIRCSNPPHLKNTSLHKLEHNALTCREPTLLAEVHNISILYMNMAVLPCNVTAYPRPSIYWHTPYGIIVHPRQRRWLTPSILNNSVSILSFIGKPTFTNSTVYAHENGSLVFHQFRNYFSGEYECIAVNPAGVVAGTANVTVISNMRRHYVWSIVISYSSALSFLLLGILIGALRLCAEKCCCPPPPKDPFLAVYDEKYFSQYNDCEDIGPPSLYQAVLYDDALYGSPYESPIKCVTPAEDVDFEKRLSDRAIHIKETLEDARVRLRKGMEKEVERMRLRAENMKKASRKAAKTFRESSTIYIRNIKTSSSKVSRTMRAGVVLGVEQIKGHVLSMKEFCGTGDVMATVSTISVSTDVDTQERKQVVKSFTYV